MRDRVIDTVTLRALIDETGLTYSEFCRQAEISYGLLKYVLRGDVQFSHRTARDVARVLNVPVDTFAVPRQAAA